MMVTLKGAIQDFYNLTVVRLFLQSYSCKIVRFVTFGKKSFSVFGPTVWNSLPLSLRTSQCFTTFKAKLKTHLFHTHLC